MTSVKSSHAFPVAAPVTVDGDSPDRQTPATFDREWRAVGRHSLVYLIGPAFSNAVGFLLIPIYTHYIDRGQYGVSSLVDVVMSVVMLLMSLGISDGLTRFYYQATSAVERRRLVSSALWGPMLLTLPVVVLLLLFAGYLRNGLGLTSAYDNYLRLSVAAAWFSMLAELGYAYLRMCYWSKSFVALTSLQILASVTLNLLFVMRYGLGIWGICYSTLIVQATVGSAMMVLILAQVRCAPQWSLVKRLLAFSVHLVPSTVALQLTNYLNLIVLRWLLPGGDVVALAHVGLYSTGQKLGVVVNRFVTVPFQSFWRPRRMELVVQDTPEVRSILAQMCTYSTVLTCQFALWIAVAAEPVLRAVCDASYWEAYRVVPWIAASYVVLGLEHHFATGMHYAQRTVWATWIGILAIGALLVGNYVLVPRVGMTGAAMATCFSVSLRSTMFWLVSQLHYPIAYELSRLLVAGGMSVALFAVAVQIRTESAWLEMLLRIVIASLFLPVMSATRLWQLTPQIDA